MKAKFSNAKRASREEVDSKNITKHSPSKIAETANKKLLVNGSLHVEARDVVEVFQRLLYLLE